MHRQLLWKFIHLNVAHQTNSMDLQLSLKDMSSQKTMQESLLTARIYFFIARLYCNKNNHRVGRDGPDTPIYVTHYKKPKISEQVSL